MTNHSQVGELVELLLTRDAAAATRLVVSMVERGTPVEVVLHELIGPAQAELGERWHRNEISVADEHAATAIVDAMLPILTLNVDDSPFEYFDRRVIVVCAVGEWHTLPARLLAETLRASGAQIEFLGPSMPPSHLARFIAQNPQDLLAVSCSTPLTLNGVLACVHVAHDVDMPVLAGGRGLGVTEHRAKVLGADLWAPHTTDAIRLASEPLPREVREPTADLEGSVDLALQRGVIVAGAMDNLREHMPAVARFTSQQIERTEEDFDYIIRYAEAAILTRDDSVFMDFLPWLDLLLRSLGLPDDTVRVSLDALRATGLSDALTALIDTAYERSVV